MRLYAGGYTSHSWVHNEMGDSDSDSSSDTETIFCQDHGVRSVISVVFMPKKCVWE